MLRKYIFILFYIFFQKKKNTEYEHTLYTHTTCVYSVKISILPIDVDFLSLCSFFWLAFSLLTFFLSLFFANVGNSKKEREQFFFVQFFRLSKLALQFYPLFYL